MLDDRERPAGRKRLQLKVNDGCGARGHRAEAGLDVVVETVRLVDDAKLLHFASEHLRELMQRGRPHLLDEPAGHQQRLEARFLAEAEVLAADELRGVVAPPAELEYANAVDWFAAASDAIARSVVAQPGSIPVK